MAGPKKRPTKGKNDYVGPYDGSNGKWMTRKRVDKDGNLERKMAPEASKPTEAGDYHSGYSKKSATKNEGSKGRKDFPFFKHSTKGK